MFWNKKENEDALPDLPPTKNSPRGFPSKTETIPAFPVSKDDLEKNEDYNEELGDEYNEEHEDSGNLEKNTLPSFPDSPIDKGFSQTAIKDAVKTEMIRNDSLISKPLEEKPFKTIEMDEWSPTKPQPSLKKPENSFEKEEIKLPIQKYQKPQPGEKDVFVKIDKFYTAKKSLDAIKEKIEEIDSLLKKIRETKLREEQELAAWERDVSTVKSRIHEITENIFEKG